MPVFFDIDFRAVPERALAADPVNTAEQAADDATVFGERKCTHKAMVHERTVLNGVQVGLSVVDELKNQCQLAFNALWLGDLVEIRAMNGDVFAIHDLRDIVDVPIELSVELFQELDGDRVESWKTTDKSKAESISLGDTLSTDNFSWNGTIEK